MAPEVRNGKVAIVRIRGKSIAPPRFCYPSFLCVIVALREILYSLLSAPIPSYVVMRLPVAANRLVLIECRVQLFDGDITGYSKQKVRPIRDVNIGTVPIDCLPNAGVVQIRVLSASETLGT